MWLLLSACAGPPLTEPAVPEGPPGPILGGGLAVGADLTRWLSDPDRWRLLHVKGGVATPIALPTGSVPDRLAVAGDVVVAGLRGVGAAALVDADDHTVRIVPVCAEPRGVDVAPDGLVWIACADGVLVHLDPISGAVLDTLPVDSDLRDVIDDGGPTLWVSRFRTAEILRVDRTTGEVVERLRPSTVDSDTEPVSWDFDPFTPFSAWRMRRHPDGGVVVLHQRGAEGTLDDRPNLTPVYYGTNLCNGIVHTTVTTVDPGGEMESSRPLELPSLAIDLAVEDDGTIALALLGTSSWGGSSAVRLLDPFAPSDECAQAVPVDTTQRLEDAHGAAVEATPMGLAVAHRVPFGVDGVPLGTASHLDLGWDLFHRATGAGVACAGCHPEGHEDGRTWRFVIEGPRRTQDLAQVSSSAPFHWGGELATLDALLTEVHERRMGSFDGATVDEEVALAAFFDRVPARRPAPATDHDLVAEGADLFVASGCLDCHTDPVPTESHDVGTGGLFQVPRLVGVRYRLPLMHDGCATTIRARFDPECGGTDHSDGHLTDPEVDALVAYLSTL